MDVREQEPMRWCCMVCGDSWQYRPNAHGGSDYEHCEGIPERIIQDTDPTELGRVESRRAHKGAR